MPGRPFVVHEANLRQLQALKPNVAVLPWGATEAHNYHLPYGTDVIEATRLGEAAVERANSRGARVALLPTVPFGVDHTQLYQIATITMRVSTQRAVLNDVVESLLRQGIERLVILNFHGGNDFKQLIRDTMFEHPIFIVQANGYQLDKNLKVHLDHPDGDHADEFETCLILHLAPELVAALDPAGPGTPRPMQLKTLASTPGVWFTRDWAATTADTGIGDPRKATAEKGAKCFEMMASALSNVLVELSAAKEGDFPFVIRRKS